jgi:peptide-methionine (S)-S-oxide reductase
VGYVGGTTSAPTYHNLGDHTETLQVDFDPSRVGYAELLEVFWKEHSPTSRTGLRQYRPVVFYHDEQQRSLAHATKDRVAAALGSAVFTAILPATRFTMAEDYHQKYSLRQTRDLLQEFKAIYPAEADLVASTAAARMNGYLAGHGSGEQLQGEIDRLGLSPTGRTRLLEMAARRAR